MRGVEIAYLLDRFLESSYDLLNDLYEKIRKYPIIFKAKTLYESKTTDYSLIIISCYLDKDKDEENEIVQTSFTSDDSEADLFNYILQELHLKKDDKSSDTEESGEEYDGWYGSD
jgi:hypothetical protein